MAGTVRGPCGWSRLLVACIVCARCVLGQVPGSTETSDEGTAATATDALCSDDADICTSVTPDEYGPNATDVSQSNTSTSANASDIGFNTTMAPSTTSSPRTDTTTTVPVVMPPDKQEICFCDLKVNSCDINCCCDSDCSDEERQVFSSCEDAGPATRSDRHCYQPHLLYRSNLGLQHDVSRESNTDLFCVITDNLPKTYQYPDRQIVKSLSEFSKLHGLVKYFGWPTVEMDLELLKFEPPLTYKAGGTVWVSKNSSVFPFSVPVGVTSASCQAARAVSYLKAWSGSCTRVVPSEDCGPSSVLGTAGYHEGLSVVATPQLVNTTQLVCMQNECLPITPYLCSGDISNMANCSKFENNSEPFKNEQLNSCQNIMKEVHYVFTHNGTQGIVNIAAFFWLADIPVSQKFVTQIFKVSFRWARDGVSDGRSGRRGYVAGRPLLVGRKVTLPSPDESDEVVEVLELKDHGKWLTIPKAMLDGKCDMDREVVTFQDDRRSSCVMSFVVSNFSSEDVCLSVQKQIFHLLLGNTLDNVTETKSFNKYVAAFGDSDVGILGEWTQIVLDRVPSSPARSSLGEQVVCRDMATNLHVIVLVSYVGTVGHPRAKVVGVSVKFGGPKQLVFECGVPHCANVSSVHSVMLTSSVGFADITQPASVHFAEPPVFKVRLPNDFFYPFLSSAVYKTRNFVCLILMFVLINLFK